MWWISLKVFKLTHFNKIQSFWVFYNKITKNNFKSHWWKHLLYGSLVQTIYTMLFKWHSKNPILSGFMNKAAAQQLAAGKFKEITWSSD